MYMFTSAMFMLRYMKFDKTYTNISFQTIC